MRCKSRRSRGSGSSRGRSKSSSRDRGRDRDRSKRRIQVVLGRGKELLRSWDTEIEGYGSVDPGMLMLDVCFL